MKADASERFDILIVGGGPAGAAAALRARGLGASVAVVEKERFPRTRACGGWIGPQGVAFVTEAGLTAKAVGAAEFQGLRLHSWDLKKSVAVKDSAIAGWIVDRARFDAAMIEAAARAGATVRFGAAAAGVSLRDDQVLVTLADGAVVAGRVLLIADGAQSPTARLAHLTPAGGMRDVATAAFAEAPIAKSPASLDVAVGTVRTVQVATVVRAGGMARVTVSTRTAGAAESLLGALATTAAGAGLLPAAVGAAPARCTLPAGVALDMDAHVGKRCVLIGDAGGFVSAFSGEGIYPAMRSGWIAAEVAQRAIGARVPQDELATFEERWRSALADYLRMPNTDLSLLMPLVFNNQQMSTRVGRAFVLGQPF